MPILTRLLLMSLAGLFIGLAKKATHYQALAQLTAPCAARYGPLLAGPAAPTDPMRGSWRYGPSWGAATGQPRLLGASLPLQPLASGL